MRATERLLLTGLMALFFAAIFLAPIALLRTFEWLGLSEWWSMAAMLGCFFVGASFALTFLPGAPRMPGWRRAA